MTFGLEQLTHHIPYLQSVHIYITQLKVV